MAQRSDRDGSAQSKGRAKGGLFGRGVRLGRAFGVDIHVDWSLLVIFALITFNLAAGVFPTWHPEWGAGLAWGVALAASVLFFASVLAHELSHALVARAQKIPVRRITLFIFGGVAHMEEEPKSPKAEFLIAAIGPFTSIVIGVLATAAGWALSSQSMAAAASDPRATLAALEPLPTLLLWLGPINLVLGVFNLVPGFPLDGGRVARSVFWWMTDDLVKATRWAAGAGQAFAWLLIAWGVFDMFTGNAVGGLWLVLIGWFLNNAARMSYRQLLIRRALEDVPVSRVMYTHVVAVDPGLSVERLVREHLMVGDQQAFPVVTDDRLVGWVSLEDVRRVPQSRWSVTPVSAVMAPAMDIEALSPDASADRAFEQLATNDVEQMPVMDHGRVAGLVRRRDLVRWLALQDPGVAAAA